MFEQEFRTRDQSSNRHGPTVEDGDESETQFEDLVEELEKNNLMLFGIIKKLDVLIDMRRSAWRERKILEDSFLLSAEARRQRLEQLSRVMKPLGARPKCSDHRFQYSNEPETADLVRHGALSMGGNDAMSSSPEVSFEGGQRFSLDHGATFYEAVDSFPGDSVFANELVETQNRVLGTPSKHYSPFENEFSNTPLVLIDGDGVREGPKISDAELCERLIADLDEVHKRSVQVSGLGLVDPAFFWSDILNRVKRAVVPTNEDLLASPYDNWDFGREKYLNAPIIDSGVNSSYFLDQN